MTTLRKQIEELSVSDLKKYPIWGYVNDDEISGETMVSPLKEVPTNDMTGKIVGTPILLRNGAQVWAMLGNLDLEHGKANEQFLTLSVLRGDTWFTMARYHDFDRDERGPVALAKFLGLSVEEVFPISYDISQYCIGSREITIGAVYAVPREILSPEELIALALR